MQRNPWEEENEYTWQQPGVPGGSYGGYSPDSAQNVTASLAKPSANPVSDVGGATTTAGLATANPYIAGAGLGIQALGTGLGAYGAYKQGQQADEDFEAQKEAYEFDKGLSLQDRALSEEERRRRAMLESGGYAGDYLQQARQNYGGYQSMRGA